MPPKKAKKISLNEFLGPSGSWADEMDDLPNAPAVKTDEERANGQYGRRDDFLSTRPDRGAGLGASQRDDLPLPTQPPYTAFIGNLAFDLTESELDEFFGSPKTKSIKIIKDREDKPKGFGYIEFSELDGLKDALAKSGTSFSGRTIRVSVAEPPKGGFGGGAEDEAKFDNPWRRDGPLPDRAEPPRRRFDGPPAGGERLPSLAEGPNDWRASGRPARSVPEPEAPSFKRKGSGFGTPEGGVGAADTEDNWTIGSKFKPVPTVVEESVSRFGGRGRGDMGPPREATSAIPDEIDWRAAPRTTPVAKQSTSPTGSTPPTPQFNRRKLELLPRSGNASVTPSPLSSPKLAQSPAASTPRASPFGAAKPVDVAAKDLEVAERIEKDKERLASPMSRTSSLRGIERAPPVARSQSPVPSTPASKPAPAPSVRPTLSFASAASKKDIAATEKTPEASAKSDDTKNEDVAEVTKKLAETVV